MKKFISKNKVLNLNYNDLRSYYTFINRTKKFKDQKSKKFVYQKKKKRNLF